MSWDLFKKQYLAFPEIGFALDSSRIETTAAVREALEPTLQKAFEAMHALEDGAIANPDEQRQVGHYWLRNPDLAPDEAITRDIRSTFEAIRTFVSKVHDGEFQGRDGPFSQLLVIGIGGSALGPQFVAEALGNPGRDRMQVAFFDNTDPEGIDLTLDRLDPVLGRTLVLVISKSGGTPETRNGMLEARARFEASGLNFPSQAVAVTGTGSKLDVTAEAESWLARFPMWDWVGGRTSETGPVGLLPAALQGFDTDALLAGAREMDNLTRVPDPVRNPAARLAAAWYSATAGKGEKDMVILPYKDRLQLFSRYLQQLVMESLGKELDLDGNIVNQGITVYGNKGSTDQHAYVQQLREGVLNFFVVFIEVLKDRQGPSIEVEKDVTSGDFLHGFFLGTCDALFEKDRQSLTLTINEVSPESVGALIALFERAVGLYASVVHINAYHQPGVEAGKKAAAAVLDVQRRILGALHAEIGSSFTAEALAAHLELADRTEWVFKCLSHLAYNGRIQALPDSAPYSPETHFLVPD